MKKLFMMLVVAMMATFVTYAQEGYDDTKHEIAISVGVYSNSQWLDVYENMVSAITGVKFDDESFTGPISAEYFYRTKNWLGVGGIFVFGQSKQDVYYDNTKDGEATNAYYTLMPAVKFDWLRKKNIGMYTKLGAGATLRHETIDGHSASTKDYNETAVHFNWQASLLGFELGSPKVRGFLELGFGEQGVALAGVRCKF